MIDDRILAGRIPRLGTITAGRGVTATSSKGHAYARPSRSSTLVVHTDDAEVANAVQVAHGGDVLTDSPTWQYDVVTDVRQMDVTVLPAGFRQALEHWRSAQCLRRCDGVTMSMYAGKATSRSCMCADEMGRGAERTCKPSTILPVLLDLDVERFGVWEVRSGAWGTAAAMKGALQALTLMRVASTTVPGILSMVDRTVRDQQGKAHDVAELRLTIARAPGEVAGQPALPVVEDVDTVRLDMLTRWADLQQQVHAAGLRDQMAGLWRRSAYGVSDIEDLTLDDLTDWVGAVERLLVQEHPSDGPEGPESAAPHLPGV